jgi:flagellar hook-length control protein FliK
MKGGAVTVQFPQIDSAEPRLLPDSSTQRGADSSFEEKLRYEQARLGLLFSPFAQLENLLTASFFGGFTGQAPAPDQSLYAELEKSEPAAAGQPAKSELHATSAPLTLPRLFESLPTSAVSQKTLAALLQQTSWLLPNIAAQPAFFNASLAGQLQPKLDLQALVDQLVRNAALVKSRGKVELSLSLVPPELGELVLTLTAHAGLVTIDIQALSGTKKLIDARRAELERALARADVHFDRITVREVRENV